MKRPPGFKPWEIPAGWRWVQLVDIGEITDGDWILSQDYAPSGVRLIQVGDIGIGRFVGKSNRFVTEERARELGCTFLRPGDLLISRMPEPIGRACRLPDLPYPCITAVDVSILRPNGDVADARFLALFMRSTEWFQVVAAFASGATRARISRSNLEQIGVPLPPILEQQRLAEILSEQLAEVERARAAVEARLEAAKLLHLATLRTVFSSPEIQRWPRRKLGEFVTSYRNGLGRRPQGKENGPIVLRLADVVSGKIDLGSPRRGSVSSEELSTYILRKGDLLFVRVNGSRNLVGRCVVVHDPPEDLLYNDHLIRVTLSEDLDSDYVKAITDSPKARGLTVSRASTSAGQLTISQDVIASIELPVPPLKEQKRIAVMLADRWATLEQLQETHVKELEGINSLPAALLRRAFAGEL